MDRAPEGGAAAAPAAAVVVVAGSLNMDFVGRAAQIPAPGQTVMGEALQQFHGGKGGNQAVAAARLGAAVRMAAAVGEDAAGAEMLQALREEGIDARGVRRVAGPSGAALITVNAAGENAITVLPGANRFAPGPDETLLEGAAWLVLQLEIPIATNRAWARAARARGITVLLNAAPMDAAARELLAEVDLLVVNEGELQALQGEGDLIPATPDTNIETALTQVAALGPKRVVVTLGARGGIACEGAQFHRWPGLAVEVVDTTGAGDTFVGALVAALAAGLDFAAALAQANHAAALSCTRPGARGGMPRREELLRRFPAMAQSR